MGLMCSLAAAVKSCYLIGRHKESGFLTALCLSCAPTPGNLIGSRSDKALVTFQVDITGRSVTVLSHLQTGLWFRPKVNLDVMIIQAAQRDRKMINQAWLTKGLKNRGVLLAEPTNGAADLTEHLNLRFR